MHYKNGREAKNGDKVLVKPSYGAPFIGIMYDSVPGNDYCNGRVALISATDPTINLQEAVRLDDALAAVGNLENLPFGDEAAAVKVA